MFTFHNRYSTQVCQLNRDVCYTFCPFVHASVISIFLLKFIVIKWWKCMCNNACLSRFKTGLLRGCYSQLCKVKGITCVYVIMFCQNYMCLCDNVLSELLILIWIAAINQRSFHHSWFITGSVIRVTRRMSLLEQELLTLRST